MSLESPRLRAKLRFNAYATLVLEENQHNRAHCDEKLFLVVGPASWFAHVLAAEDARKVISESDGAIKDRCDAVWGEVLLGEA